MHHDYSASTAVADKKCAHVVTEFVTKHGNPFEPENSNKLINIVTNSQTDHESSTFLAAVFKTGRRCVSKLLPDLVS